MTDMTPASPTPVSKPKPRPRPQVMKLTDAAAQRITEVTRRADSEIVGLRVGIKNGGCAGQSYTVEYAHDVRPSDEVVEDKGVKILIDPKAVLFLLGTEMDYKVDKMSAQFIFNNPNQTGACGCGESVQLTAAKGDGCALKSSQQTFPSSRRAALVRGVSKDGRAHRHWSFFEARKSSHLRMTRKASDPSWTAIF